MTRHSKSRRKWDDGTWNESHSDRALTRALRRAARKSGSGYHGLKSRRSDRRSSKQALRQEVSR